VLTPTPGALTLAGSTIGLTNTITPAPGVLTFAGAGDIVLQIITPGFPVTVPGAITFSGATTIGLRMIPGVHLGDAGAQGRGVEIGMQGRGREHDSEAASIDA
jgi:hypothetical protein